MGAIMGINDLLLRRAHLWGILVALFLAAGCSFEAGLTGFECSSENEVRPNGEVCRDGYWRVNEGSPLPPNPRDATHADARDTSTTPDSAHPDLPDATPITPDASDAARPDEDAQPDLDTHAQPDTQTDLDTRTETDAPSDLDARTDEDARADADTTRPPDTTPPGCQPPSIMCGDTCVDLDARNRTEGFCDTGEEGVCADGRWVCVQDAIECVRIREPDLQEHCGDTGTGNGLDDNCNGHIDEGCGECVNGQIQTCYEGPQGTLNVGVCRAGSQTCSGGHWGACVGQVTPGEPQCNNKDNDCDGQIDLTGPVLHTYYLDRDGDGFGDPRQPSQSYLCDPPAGHVRDNTDCDDTNPNTYPGAPEQCNGTDNNCDGRADSPAPSCPWGETCTDGKCCGGDWSASNKCDGASCSWASQCASNSCVNGKCCNPNDRGANRCEGRVCQANADCASGSCVDGLCCNTSSLAATGRCSEVACNGTDGVCASGYCHDIRNTSGGHAYNDICLPSQCRENIYKPACLQYLKPVGASCSGSAGFETCASQYCVQGICCGTRDVPCRGRQCNYNWECPSGTCARPRDGRPRVCQ